MVLRGAFTVGAYSCNLTPFPRRGFLPRTPCWPGTVRWLPRPPPWSPGDDRWLPGTAGARGRCASVTLRRDSTDLRKFCSAGGQADGFPIKSFKRSVNIDLSSSDPGHSRAPRSLPIGSGLSRVVLNRSEALSVIRDRAAQRVAEDCERPRRVHRATGSRYGAVPAASG